MLERRGRWNRRDASIEREMTSPHVKSSLRTRFRNREATPPPDLTDPAGTPGIRYARNVFVDAGM